MDDKTNEWEMGFQKKFVIARAYGDNWVCKHSTACSKLRSDKPGIWGHAFNHEIKEAKEKLGILRGYSSDMRKQVLTQFNIEQLDLLLAQVERGSILQKEILLYPAAILIGEYLIYVLNNQLVFYIYLVLSGRHRIIVTDKFTNFELLMTNEN